ncbi:MAG: hypothetical protein JRD89_02990 [Deltaproteobacteria bacterium]|nr:hypothetical protein [Deltaproteobacteria bacterium]
MTEKKISEKALQRATAHLDEKRRQLDFYKWKREAAQKIDAVACAVQAQVKWIQFTDAEDLEELIDLVISNCGQLSFLAQELRERHDKFIRNDDQPPIDAESEDDPPAAEGADGEPEGT